MYEGNPGEIDFFVRVSARFKLVRVRVIGSRLYVQFAGSHGLRLPQAPANNDDNEGKL